MSYSRPLDFLILLLFPAIIFWINSGVIVTGDVAWYLITAVRMLNGDTLTGGFYDSNPPMSTIIYVPAALLSFTGIPLWVGMYGYGCALILVSIYLAFRHLKAWPGLRAPDVYISIAAFTIMATIHDSALGLKDQLIGITLLPFLLAQNALTYKHNVPRWLSYAAIILGTPFILVKPHYGLLPVVLLGIRFYKQRRLSIVFDFDFLALAIGTILYVLGVLLYFPDFVSEALPVSLMTYVSVAYGNHWAIVFAFGVLFACLAVIAFATKANAGQKSACYFLCLIAALSAIPFVVQQKGFLSHLFPTLFLGSVPFFLVGWLWFENKTKNSRSAFIALSAVVLTGIGINAFDIISSRSDYMNSREYKYIVENAEGSSFFIESISSDQNFTASLYSNIPAATRFPCMWPVAGIALMEKDDPRREELENYFGRLIAEDIARYKPAFMALYAEDNLETGYDLNSIRILNFFSKNPEFQKEMAHYKKTESMYIEGTFAETLPSGVTSLPKKPVLYDVYTRQY